MMTILKKYTKFVLIAFVVAFALSKAIGTYISRKTPSVLNDFVEKNINNKRLMNSIGGYASHELSYNENDIKNGTLPFEVNISGYKERINFKGLAQKNAGGEWTVTRIDTTIIE